MRVRPFTADEWQLARALRLQALTDSPNSFRTTLGEAAGRPGEFWEDRHRSTVEDANAELWLAEVDGEPAGLAFSEIDDAGGLRIYSMWVDPAVRGRGAGAALLEAAEGWGRARGSTTASLDVTDGNEAAQRLYRKAGYQPTGGCEPLRDGSAFECLEMAKDL